MALAALYKHDCQGMMAVPRLNDGPVGVCTGRPKARALPGVNPREKEWQGRGIYVFFIEIRKQLKLLQIARGIRRIHAILTRKEAC